MFMFAINDSGRKAHGEPRRQPEEESSTGASGSVRLPGGERLRAFDVHREDPQRLVSLKEAVYDKPLDRAVFDWEYFGHPRSRDIRVFVVEHEGQLVASTTRLPATIRIAGVDRNAYFNIDSMVHPAQRRRGRMRELYEFARTHLGTSPIFFSKGSSSQIFPLLMSIGHREIVPNTQLVSYPSAARWILARLHLGRAVVEPRHVVPAGFDDFHRIERFGPEFDAYFERVSRKFPALFQRTAAFMNWRYVDIPHRRYLAYQRVVDGQIAGLVVATMKGNQGHIVDLLWDPEQEDEPERSVRFAQAFFDEHKAVRVACFATHARLREVLGRSGFVDRGETPRFSAFAPPASHAALWQSSELHVVDGDGDTEFT